MMKKSNCCIVGCNNKASLKLKLFSNQVNSQWITFDVCKTHYATAHVSRKFKNGTYHWKA